MDCCETGKAQNGAAKSRWADMRLPSWSEKEVGVRPLARYQNDLKMDIVAPISIGFSAG